MMSKKMTVYELISSYDNKDMKCYIHSEDDSIFILKSSDLFNYDPLAIATMPVKGFINLSGILEIIV